jgi:zinc transport system substrate-binding protein
MKVAALLVLLLAIGGSASAAGVVASTPWVGAMARAAGAQDVVVIAPAGLVHPPDYDPRPSDLVAVSSASHVLSGGYEGFATRLAAAAGHDAAKVTVRTTYEPAVLEVELLRLGRLFGTLPSAQAYLIEFRSTWQAGRQSLAGAMNGDPPRVAVHRFMQPWLELLGVKPTAVYGPGALSPSELARLKALDITLVVDNAHDPQGAVLAEVSGARYVKLVNFPATGEGLTDVVRANVKRLNAVIKR